MAESTETSWTDPGVWKDLFKEGIGGYIALEQARTPVAPPPQQPTTQQLRGPGATVTTGEYSYTKLLQNPAVMISIVAVIGFVLYAMAKR